MDVNNDEALEAIEMAKGMITCNNDYNGAISKLLEVQYRFPSLANVPHMITACEILRVGELTLQHGEPDWYWVLQLGHPVTSSQVKSQYTKLSSLLEGVKDEFSVAASALRLVCNAFSVLSDLPKRHAFDSRRIISWETVSLVSCVDNSGYCSDKSMIQELDSSQFNRSCVSPNKTSPVGGEVDASHDLLKDDEVHDSDKVCSEPIDISVPNKVVNLPCSMSIEVQNPGIDTVPNENSQPAQSNVGYDFEFIRKRESFSVGQIWAAYDNENLPRRFARINSVSNLPFRLHVTWLQPLPQSIHERKWYEIGLPVVCGLFRLHGDEEILVETTIFSHLVSYIASPTNAEFKIYPKANEVWAIYKDWEPFAWCDDPQLRKGCALQIVQIIEGYPRQEGVIVAALVKVDGSHSTYKRDTRDASENRFVIPPRCIYRFSHRIPANGFQKRETSGDLVQMYELDPLAIDTSCFSAHQSRRSLPPPKDSKGNSLKLEWSVKDFASGQVWAIYDGSDQMPRSYVVVNDVGPSGDVRVTYLVPHPIYDEEISWAVENIPPGCGTFKKGEIITTLNRNKFSHLVDFDWTPKVFYKIYPKKGEVWAMYRNWNNKWKRQDFEGSCCRIVEILSDFSEDAGVLISVLVEVPGYKTFFQKQLSDGFSLNRFVLRSEMLSFSHRIEAFAVPGIIHILGIPERAWHLEPDALPPLLAN